MNLILRERNELFEKENDELLILEKKKERKKERKKNCSLLIQNFIQIWVRK